MVAAGFALALIYSSTILAQAPVAVAGIVQDQTGAVVQGARITLVRQDDAARRTTTSSSDGAFRFDAVSPADYVLTVQMTGFENWKPS